MQCHLGGVGFKGNTTISLREAYLSMLYARNLEEQMGETLAPSRKEARELGEC